MNKEEKATAEICFNCRTIANQDMNTKAQTIRQIKYDSKEKTNCPYCLSPLKEELGVKKCENPNCTYEVVRKVTQNKLIK